MEFVLTSGLLQKIHAFKIYELEVGLVTSVWDSIFSLICFSYHDPILVIYGYGKPYAAMGNHTQRIEDLCVLSII